MYQVVKTFTGQGVERIIDVAGSTVFWKFNNWDLGTGAQVLSETQNRVLGGGHIPKEKKCTP